jgi:hypothetical protein
MQKADYQRYLASLYWWGVKERRLAVAGHRCEFRPVIGDWDRKIGYPLGERCNKTTNLQVHHLHYGSLGAEKDEDLEVLCRFHHLVREAVSDLDCPLCCDGPMQYEEDEIIEIVRRAIDEAGGINLVSLDQIKNECSDALHCSYCDSR